MKMFIRCVVVIVYVFFYVAARPERKVNTFPAGAKEKIVSAIKQCAGSETKTIELMKIVQEGKIRDDDEFKEFVYCSFQKSGYAYDDGRINIELSTPLYPDPVAMLKIMKVCDEKRGKTPVDTTFEFFKCFQETSPVSIGI